MSTPSLQQALSDSLLQHFPSAEVKKIDKDNYVDIHLPWIHPKRGTHLGFNTAGNAIKIVFYCREEEWVEQALSNGGGLLEKYSQGVRLKGHPEFSDVETAIAATLKFIEALSPKSAPAASANGSETYAFDKAVTAYLQGDLEYVAAYVQAGNPLLEFNGDILITNELISYVSAFSGVDRRIVNLVQAGVDLDASFDKGEGYTAAHFAAWDGKDEILYYLLDAGAKADVVGTDGYTPLFLAAAGGHLACTEILVEKGAEVNRRLTDDNIYFSKQGGTPLTVAFIGGYLELCLFLIDNGADPFVLKEPCKNAPSPDLFVNFLNLVKQGTISSPQEGQLSKILSLVGLDEKEISTGKNSGDPENSGQLGLNEFLAELEAGTSEEASNEEEETEESKDGLDLESFLESMELEEDADEFESEEKEDESEEDDDEEGGGFPMISYRKPAEEMVGVVQQYLRRWQKSSQVYAWRMGIKAFIPEFVAVLASDKVCPIFTCSEIDAICARIKSEKIIPILDYVPEEFYSHTKRVWWLVPFCIWKEDVASLVFVDKNGFYAMFSKDGEEEINMIFNWDSVYELDFEYEYDGDPNINRLTLTQESGGYLTFDEFVSTSEEGDHGSYLAVIEAIWEARRETIEASKGASMWFEGKGGEGFKEFKKPQDLMQDSKWKNPSRPDPSMFGG
uniref:ankyrin repeat domain-containing protein n=1 Tax=Algoriphagus sp. TaxID=1872435 RepID=UPI0040476F9C